MWILKFLPDWLFHLIFFAGIAGIIASFFLKFIPFVSTYRLPLKIASIVVFLIGVYFEGGISINNAWVARVKEMEAKVAIAEAKSVEANKNLSSQISQKNKEIASIQTTIKNKIKELASSMDNECKIPPAAIEVLNEAARGPKGGKK